MDRLEALAAQVPGWDVMLQPLREAEAQYHAKRDAYLGEQSTVNREPSGADANALIGALPQLVLSRLPDEVIANIAAQSGQPADWRKWPAELQQHVVKAVMEAQQGGD